MTKILILYDGKTINNSKWKKYQNSNFQKPIITFQNLDQILSCHTKKHKKHQQWI